MGKSLQGWCDPQGGHDIAEADLSGYYFGLLGHTTTGLGTASGESDAGAAGHVPNFGGTIRKLYVKIITNTRINTSTLRVRVNSVATTCLVEVTAGQTGNIRGTGEATFVSGDYIDVEVLTPQQDVQDPDYVDEFGLTVAGLWCEMETDSGHFDIHTTSNHGSSWTIGASAAETYTGDARNTLPMASFPAYTGDVANRDFYPAPIGGTIHGIAYELANDLSTSATGSTAVVTSDATLTAIEVQKVRAEGTFSGGRMYISTNPEQDSDLTPDARQQTTFGLSVNGTVGAPTYSMSNTTTLLSGPTLGWVAPSGTNAVVSGDLVCYGNYTYDAPTQYTAGVDTIVIGALTSGAITIWRRDICFESDDGESLDIFLGADFCDGYVNDSGVLLPFAAQTGTQYVSLGHEALKQTPLDYYSIDYAEIEMPSCTQLSLLRANCTFYTSGTATITVMVDGEATDQTVTISATGWQEDATNTTYVQAGHTICLRIVTDAFIGVINALAITQKWSEDCPGIDAGCEPVCPNAETFNSLQIRTLRMLGEDPDVPVYWSAAEVGRYVNDAYTAICRETRALEYIEAIYLAEDSGAGTLSRYVGPVFRATWDDDKIENVTKWELDRKVTTWEDDVGVVTHYVTSLEDERKITTYKAWDGSTVNAEEHFYNDGAYTYAAWANGASYTANLRKTVVGSDSITRAYVCILAHTSATATNKPGSGTSWTTYWAPLSLMLWCVKNPDTLTDCEEPELPPWSHLAIAYLAAARALLKHGEQRNISLAKAYEDIAGDYVSLLKGIVANRQPERTLVVGGRSRRGIRRPQPYDDVVVE